MAPSKDFKAYLYSNKFVAYLYRIKLLWLVILHINLKFLIFFYNVNPKL